MNRSRKGSQKKQKVGLVDNPNPIGLMGF